MNPTLRYDTLVATGVSRANGLGRDELESAVLEMTQNTPWEITWEQCAKFADISDADGNGERRRGHCERGRRKR
jgi:hypothetical protein